LNASLVEYIFGGWTNASIVEAITMGYQYVRVDIRLLIAVNGEQGR